MTKIMNDKIRLNLCFGNFYCFEKKTNSLLKSCNQKKLFKDITESNSLAAISNSKSLKNREV